ncbi:MAG TPA: glycosyltransferase [Stellaceae bacterium]|nr:glycosyltransferase [Stellaceae bacterium]
MKFFKRHQRAGVKVSLILLDWSVRESPHILHYLRTQTVPQDWFEIIYLEFYSRKFEGLRPYEDRVDVWAALEMPDNLYYAKHLMYNAGIALARGEIIVICDLDALVRETFIERIIRAFEDDPSIVFHIDQFRSMRREFYPFNFPTIDQVMGEGCINNVGGVTAGIRDTRDTIHTRNYGSCFCARRSDVIAIGGADMHIDYVGHICGPYDMSFRLRNLGRRIVWAEDEFMYHTWHPGTDGGDNYMGPHDGRNFSIRALEAAVSGAVPPLEENPAIVQLRNGTTSDPDAALASLIEPRYLDHWRADTLIARAPRLRLDAYRTPLGLRDGRLLISDHGRSLSLSLAPGDGNAAPLPAAGLSMLCAPFRLVDLSARLYSAFNVRKKALRFPVPEWVRTILIVPLLTLAFPLAVIRGGYIRQRIRALTGEFRDLCDPIVNLAAVLREVAPARSPPSDIVVVHDSKVVLRALRFLAAMRLLPRCASRLVCDGKALRDALTARASRRREGALTLVPSSLHIRYHLEVPPVTATPGIVVV